jgi:hypothetical protein
MIAAAGATIVLTATLTMLSSAATPKFYDDDPVWQEHDTEDASAMKPLRSI